MWASFVFKAAFSLGALVHSFSGSFAGRFLEASWRLQFFWIESVSVCCVSSCYSRQTDDQIRSLCGALAVFRLKSHWIITINGKTNVWKCKLIFTTDTLQIEITDLTPFLAAENTSVLIILATTVYLYMHIFFLLYIFIYIYTHFLKA